MKMWTGRVPSHTQQPDDLPDSNAVSRLDAE
jgi:hypothetical protein